MDKVFIAIVADVVSEVGPGDAAVSGRPTLWKDFATAPNNFQPAAPAAPTANASANVDAYAASV